jgi:hypothetical protein
VESKEVDLIEVENWMMVIISYEVWGKIDQWVLSYIWIRERIPGFYFTTV